MLNNNIPDRKKSRLAALLFVVICFPAGAWALGYVPSKILILKDAAATANNILSNEVLYRSGILGHFISTLGFFIMALMFYSIFKNVNKNLSRIMIIPLLVQAAVVVVFEVFKIAALMIMKGSLLMNLDLPDKQELVYLLVRMQGYGVMSTQILLGLFFLPFGMVVYKSGFVPKIIGILLIITGIAYIADTTGFIMLNSADFSVIRPFIRICFLGAAVSFLWFLIVGVRPSKQVPMT